MNQRLIDAHEKERARIARELHDDVGQRLALVTMMLDSIKRALPVSPPALTEEIQQTRQQVEFLARDVQSLSHNLHPSKPKYLGLAKASASFCEELAAQGVQIEFRSENIPTDLPEEVSLCLYRVLQESLQNAIKHSGSGRFEVLLIGGSNEILLSVQDSGIGFDPAQAMRGTWHRAQQHEGTTETREREHRYRLATELRHYSPRPLAPHSPAESPEIRGCGTLFCKPRLWPCDIFVDSAEDVLSTSHVRLRFAISRRFLMYLFYFKAESCGTFEARPSTFRGTS